MSLYFATFASLATIPVCLYVPVPRNLLQPLQPYLVYISLYLATFTTSATIPVYLSLYLATFATILTIPVCLYVSVPCNLSNLCNHTCLPICLCTLQPLQPLQPYLSVYVSLYLATFTTFATIPVYLSLYLATFATIPVCLYVSVPCNHCNLCNHTFLSICIRTLQPYLFVYMSRYLSTFAALECLATITVCLSVFVPCKLFNPCNHTCLSISLCTSQPLQPLQPYLSVYMALYLTTFATIPFCLYISVPRNLCNPCTIPVCLYVCVPCKLCNPCNHTCLSVSVPRNPCNPCNHTCLSVSVLRNLCNPCSHTCLSICLCTSQPLQPLQPYLSFYMAL